MRFSVLSFTITIILYPKQSNKNIKFCIEEKVIIWLNFNPGLALAGFRKILPGFQQVNLTWTRDPIENQHLVSGQLKKKNTTSMSYTLESAIWPCDTGRQIPCFDRCQLIITWMSNIKEVHGKPRLHVSVNLLFGVWPSCCATLSSPSSCVHAHKQCCWPWQPWENQLMGFLFFPIWVWGSAWGPFGPPELH